MRILPTLTRYGDTGEGDVKMLTDRDGLYRLRVGKWWLFFDLDSQYGFTASIIAVRRTEN